MRKFFAIIGHPVAHSLSPHFQQAALDALDIDAAYLPFDLSPENLSRGLEALKILRVSGFNITIPHKESILPFLDRSSEEVRQIGAVNTVTSYTSEDGEAIHWAGHNTDGPGFSRALEAFLEQNRLASPSHALVFGAGGSSRAVLWSLARIGISHLCLVNRTVERAGDLIHRPAFASISSRMAFALSDRKWQEWLRNASHPFLINTLSLHSFKGSGHHFPPLESTDLKKVSAMIDLSYPPAKSPEDILSGETDGQTPFLKAGAPFEIPRQNGLGMLLCQGALAFELWTGERAPVRAMENSLIERTGQKDLWRTL
jgi:shikimate dehydrogenase